MIEQRTEEWFQQRLGKVTASRISDVMTKTKSGAYGASRKNYMMQLLCERLTGGKQDDFQNAAMLRGIELEPFARISYEALTGRIVKEAEFIIHPTIQDLGASPDGLVDDCGMVEIKCPNTAQHVEFIRTGKVDSKYEWQMRAQMACADRDWNDYVTYDDRMPEHLQTGIRRILRDEKKEDEMLCEVKLFLEELAEIEKELRGLNDAA